MERRELMGLKVFAVISGLGMAASVSTLVILSPLHRAQGQPDLTNQISSTGSPQATSVSSAANKPLVVIDPGHGAEDPGAKSIYGVDEKDITWKMSSLIAEDLKERGVHVTLTRSQDENPSLADRLSYGLSEQPAFFLSVHANSYDGSPAVRGAEIHVYDPTKFAEARYPGTKLSAAAAEQSIAISESIVNELTAHSVGIPVRAGEPLGIRYDADFVCRLNDGPAALIELGYLSNPGDAKLLTNTDVQAAYAADIADGIARKVLASH